ncbi:DUF4124 domain-containing protein [Thalassotalea sp. LPB0316]|uniref:DUF4124 domain-containing protein n=1 Tax=Thalassotalea sp. LPB0316 TaxID=2769490 RepID=UPI001866B817|nr:DUF4124 domain-containing protein [Thalassotalea sp. LPB0316]QOL25762.1 DUF4124 domain-containing protein [Thalassotalea sp. LPB0316]
MKKYVLGLVVFSSFCFGQNVVVYRWVDDNNVVHFSQHQPAHDNYTTITMSSRAKKSAEPVQNTTPDTPVAANFSGNDTAASSSVVSMTIEQRCQDAQNNIKTLSAFDQVQYTDSQGQVHVLSDDEKQQQLLLSQKQVEIYCQ